MTLEVIKHIFEAFKNLKISKLWFSTNVLELNFWIFFKHCASAEEHITAIISFKTHFDKRISSPSLDSGCSKKQRSLKSYVRSKMFAIAIIIHLPLKWCPFQKWKLLRSSYFTFRNASENITMFSNCKKKYHFKQRSKMRLFLVIFNHCISSIFDDKLVWFCALFQKFMSHPQDNFRLLTF